VEQQANFVVVLFQRPQAALQLALSANESFPQHLHLAVLEIGIYQISGFGSGVLSCLNDVVILRLQFSSQPFQWARVLNFHIHCQPFGELKNYILFFFKI
jgi:hypothetical protein